MQNYVVHWEISATDLKTLTGFYSNVFDWTFEVPPDTSYAFLPVGEGERGLSGGLGVAPQPDHTWVTFYMDVDDTDAYLDKFEAAGGETVEPATTIPGSITYAVFDDPERHRVGLVKECGIA